MKKERELMMDGGRAFRLSKEPSFIEEFSNGTICLLLNLIKMHRVHNDRPKQTRKRWMKVKRLITNILRGGAKAPERLKAI
jgi:hypothetical protein